jgi:hypothetical protein
MVRRATPRSAVSEDLVMEANEARKQEQESRESRPMKVLWMITERGDRSFWTRVGTGYMNRDGSINLVLDAMPVGASKLQLRDYSPRDAEAGGGPDEPAPRGRGDHGRGSDHGRGPRPTAGFAP